LYKGRVLESGMFTDLKQKGILNTTVDPLYKITPENESDHIFDGHNDGKDEVSDSCQKIVPQTSKGKGLQISEEDRAIGTVSSKLYWNYFRSRVPALVIIGVFCLCLITQGKLNIIFYSESHLAGMCVARSKATPKWRCFQK